MFRPDWRGSAVRWTLTLAVVVAGLAVSRPTPASAATATLVMSPTPTAVVGAGQTDHFHVEYDPDGSGPQLPQFKTTRASWSTSASSVATVKGGDVKGVSAGKAVITATYQGLSASTTVTVAGTWTPYSFVTPDGRTRSYTLYVPSAPLNPAPLVLSYHGYGGNAEWQASLSQTNAEAHARGFLVAYPLGTGLTGFTSWNAGSCCNPAASNGVDDVKFSSMVIDHVASRYNVDLGRVYAAGFSNGGMMTHRIGCQLANRIAAIAPLAGPLSRGGDFPACSPSRAVSVLDFHGTTDEEVPYYGGEGCGGTCYSVPATIQDWRNINGITAGAVVSYRQGIVTCEEYTSDTAEVELCTANPSTPLSSGGVAYDGGGHAWPSGVRWSSNADVPTYDVAANSRIWTFFTEHPM